MKWLILVLISLPIFAQDCITSKEKGIRVCVGDKVQSMHSRHAWVEVMGIDKNNMQGKPLIIKTGRDFHRMNSSAGDDLCNGCEPAGLDDIRVGPDAKID
jgi:hypothetical protein